MWNILLSTILKSKFKIVELPLQDWLLIWDCSKRALVTCVAKVSSDYFEPKHFANWNCCKFKRFEKT